MRPIHEVDAFLSGANLLHALNEIVHVLMHQRFEASYRTRAVRRKELPSNFAMLHWIFFPDDAAQIRTTVLKVRLLEYLQTSIRRGINIMECLWSEKYKLVGCNPDYIPVFAKGIFNGPRVTPRKPRIKMSQWFLEGRLSYSPVSGVPNVRDSSDSWSGKIGKRVEEQKIKTPQRCIDTKL